MASGLYIHIPFCVRKCAYCDFVSYAGVPEETQSAYVDALIEEILWCGVDSFDTIFIGGGTPSCIDEKYIAKILDVCAKKLYLTADAEISIEVNPATLNKDKLKTYKDAGINRISMGIQSLADDELALLGRTHTSKQARESYELIRQAGFDNVNLDVMFGIPNQSEDSFFKTLNEALALAPEHVSVYSLILEPGTPLYDCCKKGTVTCPEEETERRMYYLAIDYLQEHGYRQYEISNFAMPARECRHNLKYWRCETYRGVGAAAHSYDGGRRWSNVEDLNHYIELQKSRKSSIDEIINLDERDKIGEFMIMGLRLCEGVCVAEFGRRFNADLMDVYKEEIEKYVGLGFMRSEGGKICLTREGFSVSNSVLCDFLLE